LSGIRASLSTSARRFAGARSRAPGRSPRRSGAAPRPLPSWLLRFVQLARLLIVACALQLSGGAHVLVDLVGVTATACIDTCDCPEDSSGDEHGCPPDCSDCSCPHGRLPSLPPEIVPPFPAPIAWELPALWTPYFAAAPPSPPLSSLERPPRA